MGGACESIHVVKVGGSLLDVDDLAARLDGFMDGQRASILFVLGGGSAADVVRDVDRRFGVSEADGHWLAVRAMELNACCFVAGAGRLMGCEVELAVDRRACEEVWLGGGVAVMQPMAWLMAEEERGVAVPHVWSFTSDSIAAHVAKRLGAARLTLLKSASPREGNDGDEEVEDGADVLVGDAMAQGLVDGCFAGAMVGIERVEVVNLRRRGGGMWRLR